MSNNQDAIPLTWANGKPQGNFIVLTDRAAYVAMAPAKQRVRIVRDMEDGAAPEEVLDAPQKVLVKRVTQLAHPAVLKYATLLGFVVLCTGCMSVLELTWGLQRGPALCYSCAGIGQRVGYRWPRWLFCLHFVAIGFFDLVSPSRNVVYVPDPGG